MFEPTWTDDEKELLKLLCNDEKMKLEYLVQKIPNHSEGAIRTKCRQLGITFNKERKYWSDEEKQRFAEDWNDPTISDAMLSKRYQGRSITALRSAAARMQLGERMYDDSYLTMHDIMNEMQVSKDRVRTWMRQGLRYKKSKIKPLKYLFDEKDLLDFLESHQHMYDASLISHYLFSKEPDWLRKKRFNDKGTVKTKSLHANEYSDSELRYMIDMFKKGYDNKRIADTIGRTEYSVERMLSILGYSRKKYNDYEIDIIRENAGKINIDEIVNMLPLRTKSGVIAKCEQLGIKYSMKRK